MQKKLHLGLVTSSSYATFGGVQYHTQNLGEALIKLGTKVTFISPTSEKTFCPTPHLRIGRAMKIPTPNGSWATFSVTSRSTDEIAKIIAKRKIDILHFQELNCPLSSWQILAASMVKNVATFHSGWNRSSYFENLQPFFKSIGQLLKNKIQATIVVSKTSAHCSQGVAPTKINIIPIALNLTPYQTLHPRPLKLSKNKINLLYIGRLEKRKGVNKLIKAFNQLKPDIKQKTNLYLIGKGVLETTLRLQTKINKLENQVHFLGALSENQKIAYLQHCDIFISPATHGESLGITLVEAMAAGKPIIAGNNDGYQETLADYPCQRCVVDPKNSQNFAKVIEELISDEKLRRQLACWGPKHADKYSAERVAKQHLKIYTQLKIIANHQLIS